MAGLGQVVAIKCGICEDKIGILFCYGCSHYLCQPCELFHRKIPSSKHHHVTDSYKVDKLVAKNNFSCEDHKREYALFCTSCDVLICALCVTTNHSDHNYKALSDAVSEAHKNLKENVVHLKENVGSANRLIENVKTTQLEEINAERELFTTEVSQTSNVLNEIIESISRKCITKTTDHYQLEHSRLSDILVALEGLSCENASLCDKCERALTDEYDISVILNHLTLTKELNGIETIPNIDGPKIFEKFSKERFIKSILDEVLERNNMKLFPKQEELDDLKVQLQKEKNNIVSIQKSHEGELTKLRDDTRNTIERTKIENKRRDKQELERIEKEEKTRSEIAKLQATLSQKDEEIMTLKEKIRMLEERIVRSGICITGDAIAMDKKPLEQVTFRLNPMFENEKYSAKIHQLLVKRHLRYNKISRQIICSVGEMLSLNKELMSEFGTEIDVYESDKNRKNPEFRTKRKSRLDYDGTVNYVHHALTEIEWKMLNFYFPDSRLMQGQISYECGSFSKSLDFGETEEELKTDLESKLFFFLMN